MIKYCSLMLQGIQKEQHVPKVIKGKNCALLHKKLTPTPEPWSGCRLECKASPPAQRPITFLPPLHFGHQHPTRQW